MAALRLGLEADVYTWLMKQGHHLLAPTRSVIDKHGQQGSIMAGMEVCPLVFCLSSSSLPPAWDVTQCGCQLQRIPSQRQASQFSLASFVFSRVICHSGDTAGPTGRNQRGILQNVPTLDMEN
eukprot:GHUV01029504.1.p2 GENE.GHUV01029504.1~~GHUV01029504.1.p2  ORF type:complete len:123 (-),score=22.72 GHUV01029504.1:352-720(-)